MTNPPSRIRLKLAARWSHAKHRVRLVWECGVRWIALATIVTLLLAIPGGCGTTQMRDATDQLLLSDAVDRSISSIDFRPLNGRHVYLDSTYVRSVKGLGFVNSDYIISSLRQQIVAAGCLLEDERKDAELILEARVGTLGADGYAVTYGIPASSALSSAASLISQAPPVPAIPEISFGRRESNEASAKIAVFAYDQKTRLAVWQSGVSRSEADSRGTWVLGVGPFESGSIRDKTRLAGEGLPLVGGSSSDDQANSALDRPPVDYTAQIRFRDGYPIVPGAPTQPKLLNQSTPAPIAVGNEGADALQQVSFEEALRQSDAPPAGEPSDSKSSKQP